jgi:hypothetical protein
MHLHEPTDERDARGEPDDDSCRLGISRHCTEEGAYLWEGEPCCVFCLNLAEESWEKAQERNRELTEAENLWVRR